MDIDYEKLYEGITLVEGVSCGSDEVQLIINFKNGEAQNVVGHIISTGEYFDIDCMWKKFSDDEPATIVGNLTREMLEGIIDLGIPEPKFKVGDEVWVFLYASDYPNKLSVASEMHRVIEECDSDPFNGPKQIRIATEHLAFNICVDNVFETRVDMINANIEFFKNLLEEGNDDDKHKDGEKK